ncbi:beta-phosphoglucomutase family hydrolase [Celerinatantimonas diazotrophica]|uniref:HAD superfamily hydrolase (TIGR01509 family)/beta-phosphoglucomutase family hydrolase n=1 Tax=Celerinatantimonas diazotrophica TaxID=412034 RepID=A0A4R1J9E7_9GAMM|nr:beta-phosphoglucomutase family hydrolase [Celerinatantimonas diazotrophica]TCK47222.1 HAD superfamily hydrolase (TIGR01509 family)/beta-phosphoglucomutase family hydrolase [Celerinatantimonas diazotrophica]CAG9295994.1 Fructose-1-phosphate phosphatase YqaB [Celerinatantimonas diazotrophica]
MYDKYAALIFDMDGTVIDSLPAHQRAWEQILAKYQIPYTAKVMNHLNGWPALQTVNFLCSRAQIENLDNVQISAEKEALYQQLAPQMVKITPVIDIVKKYTGKKPIALGTGASTSEATNLLSHLGITELFDHIVGSDQVEKHKPAPDTFLRCAKLLNVPSDQCIVFEDAQAGFDAAQAAGMAHFDVRAICKPSYFVQ